MLIMSDTLLNSDFNISTVSFIPDRPCGLVVGVLGYRSRGPDSIPGATRFSEK
jgi:hypothetical protein